MQILESKSLVHSYPKELKEEALKVASSNICSDLTPPGAPLHHRLK